MNQNLIKVITQYLTIESSYAVIINGSYGIGKTYFFKKILSPEIQSISISRDYQKKFIPIHISLFGLNSLEEIQAKIFISLKPYLNKKGAILSAGIVKSLFRGIAGVTKAGDVDKYLSDATKTLAKIINYDQLVICFDDFDRKSSSLQIDDLMGFINSLVENYSAKVIIIANESVLLEDPKYLLNLKEKVIGVTINYIPNTKEVIETIIKTKYADTFKSYHTFLSNNISRIIEVIVLNESNFRNLMFFLEHFKTIYYELEKIFQENKDFRLLKEDKLNAILNFTLTCSIEFKAGLMSEEDSVSLEPIGISRIAEMGERFSLAFKEESEESPRTYSENFLSKYYLKERFYYFQSILDFLLGKREFNIQVLKAELEEYFVVQDGKIPDHIETLQKLSFIPSLDLKTNEYRSLIKQMLEYADKGLYNLKDYYTAFYFVIRYHNILNYDINKLKTRIKKAIIKGYKNFKYENHFHMHFFMSNNEEFLDDLKEIAAYCIDINNQLKKDQEKKEAEDLFKLFENNLSEFISITSEPEKMYKFRPILTDFSIKKVLKKINSLNSHEIWDLIDYFKGRYNSIIQSLHPEKDFVIKLREAIDNPTKKRKIKNLRNMTLDYLSNALQECEKNFPN